MYTILCASTIHHVCRVCPHIAHSNPLPAARTLTTMCVCAAARQPQLVFELDPVRLAGLLFKFLANTLPPPLPTHTHKKSQPKLKSTPPPTKLHTLHPSFLSSFSLPYPTTQTNDPLSSSSAIKGLPSRKRLVRYKPCSLPP